MPLTNNDIKKIQKVVHTVIQGEVDPLKDDIKKIRHSVDTLTSSVDGLVNIVGRHDQELTVLGAQQDIMKKVLVKKSVASEDELAVV